MAFNYARFGNALDTGYGYVLINTGKEKVLANSLGIYSIKNILQNFYNYFFAFPEVHIRPFKINVVSPGVSFFIASPFFLVLTKFKVKEQEDKVIIISSLLAFLSVLMWYWPGWWQVGPRYMLDFLPLVYLLIIRMYKNKIIENRWIAVIILAAFINLGLFWNVFLRN